MNKLLETGDMSDTAPADLKGERYVGLDSDEDGNTTCPKCGKPYKDCTCEDPETTVRSKDIPDDLIPRRMGNVPQEDKQEESMDFYEGLDALLLEEFAPNPVKKVEESRTMSPDEAKNVQTFTDKFHDYMQRNGDRLDRKPSDVSLAPTQTIKYLYHDHFFPKSIR